MWEDCSHRIEALNLLLHIAEEVEENLKTARKYIDAEEFKMAVDKLDSLLDSLDRNLNQCLKTTPKHHNMNQLDLNMRTFRHSEFAIMMEDIPFTKRELVLSCDGEIIKPLWKIMMKVEDYLARLKGLCFEVINLKEAVIYVHMESVSIINNSHNYYSHYTLK